MFCDFVLKEQTESYRTKGSLEAVGGGVMRKRSCACHGKGNPMLLSWLGLGYTTSEKEKVLGCPYSLGWRGESHKAGCQLLAPSSS